MTFLLPLIGLIAGIVAGSYIGGPLWSALPILGALAVYLIVLRKSDTPLKALRLNRKHSVWIVLLFSGVGMLTAWFHSPHILSDSELKSIIAVYGEVTALKTAASGDVLAVRVIQTYNRKGTPADHTNLNVSIKTDGASALKGDLVFFPCSLSQIKDNGNYRSSGYADRMRKKGFIYSSVVSSDAIAIKGHSDSPLYKSSEWRDKIEIALEKSSLNRETAEFIISILLGDKDFIDNDIRTTFNNAGVAHILALSGLHVAIIMGIILFLLYPLKAMGLHRIRYWVALAMVWAYAYFSGLAPSTVRACIMTSFLVLALSIQRKNASSNALLASAFVILLVEPAAIYDVGMQLSFLCVACILAFAGPLNTVNQHQHPRLHSLNASILVSLVATLGTWVVVSYYFKRIPLLFLPVNLLMLPLLPFYLSIALAYTLACLCGVDSSFIAKILDMGYSLFMFIASRLSAFGSATIEYHATFPVVLLWLLGVLVMGYAIRRKRKFAAGMVAASLFIGSIILIPIMASSQPDSIIFQKKYSDISMALYDADKENVMAFPRNAISKLRFKDSDIFSVDCTNTLDTLAKMMTKSRSRKKYLILGSGFKNKKLSDIPGLDSFDKIVFHPSIRRKKEKELLQEALDSGVNKLHSLRTDGPLEINL